MKKRPLFIHCMQSLPETRLGDIEKNKQAVLHVLDEAEKQVRLVQFPPLVLTGLSCGDYVRSAVFREKAQRAFWEILHRSRDKELVFNLGIPCFGRYGLLAFECLIYRGAVIAAAPYSHFEPERGEELARSFAPAARRLAAARREGEDEIEEGETPELEDLPSSAEVFLDDELFLLEIATDLERETISALPRLRLLSLPYEASPSNLRRLRLASASDAEKKDRLTLIMTPGRYESSSDRSYRAAVLSCCGDLQQEFTEQLGSSRRTFLSSALPKRLANHARLRLLRCEELGEEFPMDAAADPLFRNDHLLLTPEEGLASPAAVSEEPSRPRIPLQEHSLLPENPLPFLAADPMRQAEELDFYLENQISNLARRLEALSQPIAVLGLSGGLDSTAALLSLCLAFRRLGRPFSEIFAVSMPGFGSGKQTKSNSDEIAAALSVHYERIPILKAVRQHFKDINQPEDVFDITFENAQARERTQILMDLANRVGGLVFGTGDLSETALGWSTYNGDHMSMYGLNGSLPKTMLPAYLRRALHLLQEAERNDVTLASPPVDFPRLAAGLEAVIAVPVSPELLPLHEDASKNQKTEDSLGPYLLHDFFIYHYLHESASAEDLFRYACEAFSEHSVERFRASCAARLEQVGSSALRSFRQQEIQHCLQTFARRLRQNQFKRSCMPEGAGAGPFSFSPRTGLQLPGDFGGEFC